VYWLLLDSVATDAFNTYRRTLCGEGSGPGAFRQHICRVLVSDNLECTRLHRGLNNDLALEYDIKIRDKALYAGCQLVATPAVLHVTCRDDILLTKLPVELTFRGAVRSTGFGATTTKGQVCAVWDIACQGAIFFSLDVLPFIISIRLNPTFEIQTMLACAVIVACCHSCLFYFLSATLDYAQKIATLRQAFSESRGPKQVQRTRMRSRQRNTRKLSTRERSTRQSMFAACQLDLENVFGAMSIINEGCKAPTNRSHDQDLNLCLMLCRYSLKHHRILYCLLVASLITCLGTAFLRLNMVWVLFAGISIVLGTIAIFTCVRTGGLSRLGQIADMEDSMVLVGIWPMWFKINCSMTRCNAVFCAVFWGVTGPCVVYVGLLQHSGIFVALGLCMCLWSAAFCFTIVKAAKHMWKLILIQVILFAIVALVMTSIANGWVGLCYTACFLYVTQVGCIRQTSRQRVYVVFLGFFAVFFVMVGAVTFLATSDSSGVAFGTRPLDWCTDEQPTCKNFTFQTEQRQDAYELCHLAWPMGPSAQDDANILDSVKDKCADTHLSIIDFGQMATMSYYLPDVSAVQAAIHTYFPGWQLVHNQVYDFAKGHYTTFLHISRGSTSVIAVRGTWSALETLQDLNFWTPVAFMQLASLVGPSMFDRNYLVRAMVTFSHPLFQTKKNQFYDLYTYTAEYMKIAKPKKLYITGHSLGGGLANVIGALAGIPAITFSSPGLRDSAFIMQPSPTNSALTRRSITVAPQWDIVPKIDAQSGTLFPIECPYKDASMCHGLDATMCELLSACGDGGGRNIARGYVRKCGMCPPQEQRLQHDC